MGSIQSISHDTLAKSLFCELSGALAMVKKDMRIYYLKPNIIVSGILFPLFMFLSFAIGKNAPLGTLIPTLLSITLMFSSSQIEPVSITMEKRVKTFERLFSAPITLYSLALGMSLSGFLYSLGIACLPLAVGIFIFSTTIVHASALVVSMILTAFCFAALGTLFAAYPTEIPGEVMSMLNTVPLQK
ncbi:MAG: ABC transporter permease [Bacteroidota bacterium]|nr:ABC transporter permease [Bacteroidota bacterium]